MGIKYEKVKRAVSNETAPLQTVNLTLNHFITEKPPRYLRNNLMLRC